MLALPQSLLHFLAILETGGMTEMGGQLVVGLSLACLSELQDGFAQVLRESIVHLPSGFNARRGGCMTGVMNVQGYAGVQPAAPLLGVAEICSDAAS